MESMGNGLGFVFGPDVATVNGSRSLSSKDTRAKRDEMFIDQEINPPVLCSSMKSAPTKCLEFPTTTFSLSQLHLANRGNHLSVFPRVGNSSISDTLHQLNPNNDDAKLCHSSLALVHAPMPFVFGETSENNFLNIDKDTLIDDLDLLAAAVALSWQEPLCDTFSDTQKISENLYSLHASNVLSSRASVEISNPAMRHRQPSITIIREPPQVLLKQIS